MTPIFIYYFIRYLYINTNIKLKRMYRKIDYLTIYFLFVL